MDLMIRGEPARLLEVLGSLGFEVRQRRLYGEARLGRNGGRLHLLFTEGDSQEFYCDLHFDSTFHLLNLGVDYRVKPQEFYEKELHQKLSSQGLQSKIIGGFDWFNRRNKAVVTGLRLK